MLVVFNFLPCFYSEPQLFFCYIYFTNCEYSRQISAVKKNIETVQGVDVYPAAQQMLIHQGKVLKDGTTLEENKVAENSFIVIMLSKVKLSFISFSVSKTTLILNLLKMFRYFVANTVFELYRLLLLHNFYYFWVLVGWCVESHMPIVILEFGVVKIYRKVQFTPSTYGSVVLSI